MKVFRTLMIIGAIAAAITLQADLSSAGDATTHQAFDRDACYAKCGCDAVGMVAACFDCKQECDRKFWAQFDQETGGDKTRREDDQN